MAGQGSLCQRIHSARSFCTASRLRSILFLAGLLMVPAMAPAIVLGQSTTQTDLVPASHIRLHSSTPSNIVAPGSPIELSAHVESLIEQASRRLVFRASMLRASDGEIVATSREMVAVDSDGNGGPHTFELTTPEQEGVYEIRIDLTIDDETIWDRFRKPKPALDQLGRPVFVIRDELTAPATRVVTDQGDTTHAFAPDLVEQIFHAQRAINWLPSGHCHRIVVEDFVSNIDLGRDGGTNRKNPRMEVCSITKILKDMLRIGKGCLAYPGSTLTAHLGKRVCFPIGHPGRHVMTADSTQCMTTLGYFSRCIVGATRTKMRHSLNRFTWNSK